MSRTALLLWACLAAAAAGCAYTGEPPAHSDVLSRYEVADREPDPPSLASDTMLRRSGVLLYNKGRYKRAVQHLDPLARKYPRHFLATAYLGLCRWFMGRPDETAALWQAYDLPEAPGLGRALRAEALGLALLAERLRARGAVSDAGQGLLPPVSPGLTAVFDFAAPAGAEPGRADPDGADPDEVALGAALAALAAQDLDHRKPDGQEGLWAAPRERLAALLKEGGAGTGPPKVLEACRAARLAGAEFVVLGSLGPGPAAPGDRPGGRLLDMQVLPAETPPERRSRIQRRMTRAGEQSEAVAREASALSGRMAALGQGLDYFQDLADLDGLLAERAQTKERTALAAREGRLDQARQERDGLDRLQERIETLHARTRDFQRASFALRLNVFSLDAEDLRREMDQARARAAELKARARELEALRLGLAAQLAEELPPQGASVIVDLPLPMAGSWPGRIAEAVRQALGPAQSAGPGALGASQAMDVQDLVQQGRTILGPLPGPAMGLPQDFDLEALAGLGQEDMIKALEGRILGILARETNAFLARGGSRAEFDRLAEGR